MNALVQINDVTKRYDGSEQPAVDGITLEIAAGEAVAVMGPSGSGKSTLLNLIAGLDRPTNGTITVAGQRIDRLSEAGMARCRRREIGMIFQFFNLLDDLTVADNVLLPAQLDGMPRSKARARVRELLGALHIERHRDAYPGASASGWQSPVHWSTGRLSCWPMSRPGRSTPRRARRSVSCCSSSTAPGRRS